MRFDQQAREIAAEIKARITCESLHALIRPDRQASGDLNPPVMRVVTPGELGLLPEVMLGWTFNAEQRIAEVVEAALTIAWRKGLSPGATT